MALDAAGRAELDARVAAAILRLERRIRAGELYIKHAQKHRTGDRDPLVLGAGSNVVTVRKNSGANVGTRGRLNLIEGSNITLTVADDTTDNEVDVTIAAAGGGGGSVATDVIWDALGDTVYGTGADTAVRLAGNTTTTRKFLRQTGDGAASAAPAWDTVGHADVVTTGLKQTLLLQGWQPTTTSGCTTASKQEIGTTTKHDIFACAFPSASPSSAFLHHPMPDNWDGGTVTFRVWWLCKSGFVATTSDGVAWGLKASSYGDGDALDAVFGTEVVVTDTGDANNDANKTADSTALTIGNTPAAGDLIHWVITRKTADAADDWAADAQLLAVVVEYGVSALSS